MTELEAFLNASELQWINECFIMFLNDFDDNHQIIIIYYGSFESQKILLDGWTAALDFKSCI